MASGRSGLTKVLRGNRDVSDAAAMRFTPHSQEWLCYWCCATGAVLLVLCYGGALLLPQIGPLVLMTTVRICDTKMRGRPHIPLRRLLMFPAQSCRIAAHSCARVRQVGPHNVGRTFKAERPRVRRQRRVAVAKPRGAPFANRVTVIGDSDGPRHRAPSVVAADCGFLLKANPRSPGDAVLAVRDGAVAGRSLVFERVACRGVAGGFGFAPGLNLVPGTLAQARNRPRLR